MQTWSCSSARRWARSSSLSELGLLSLSSLSLLGSLSEVEDDEEEEEEEDEEEDVGWPLMDMAVCSTCGSSGILAKRNSNTSWGAETEDTEGDQKVMDPHVLVRGRLFRWR